VFACPPWHLRVATSAAHSNPSVYLIQFADRYWQNAAWSATWADKWPPLDQCCGRPKRPDHPRWARQRPLDRLS
jgi:hypothetical protein